MSKFYYFFFLQKNATKQILVLEVNFLFYSVAFDFKSRKETICFKRKVSKNNRLEMLCNELFLEVYSELSQTSKMERFMKVVNDYS